MALNIYTADKILLSDVGGSLVTAHNGVIGESVDILFYIKNDNASAYYTSLSVLPVDSDSVDDTIGVYGTGRGVKLSAGSRQPTEAEWDNVLAGDYAELSSIGTSSSADTTTFFPVWMRVIVPGNTEAKTFTDLSLQISGSEHLVGA